jgi:signal transduction histidine kinase
MRRRAASRGVELIVNYPDETKELKADIAQLRQILFNLFDNSLDAIETHRFESPNSSIGRVECVAQASNGNLQINWRDNGCGIPPDRLQSLFTPFVTSKSTGNGLGLFIVKNIIENHGGQVKVQSETGKGTSFTITLPLLSAQDSEAVHSGKEKSRE